MNFLEMIHLGIALLLTIGGYFLSNKYLPIYLLSLPYIVIDWNDTDKVCWLTKLNQMIQYKTLNPEVNDEIENSFLNGLMRQQGIVIEDDTFTFLLYVIFIASWLYGFYRLTKQYKIKMFPNKYVKNLSYFMIIGWIVITLPSLKKKEINNKNTNEL